MSTEGIRVRMEGVTKRFGSKTALDGISLSVRGGEVYGFIGPNGAGKTTTMGILVGLTRPDTGLCEIDGRSHGTRNATGIGFLPEEPAFPQALTGREYLRLVAGTMRLPETEADRLLARVSLTEAAHRRAGGYSRGMRQRLGLACALLGDPDLFVLDEPSSALDPEGRKDVVDLILTLKAEGRTVFLSTHILSDIERICDRIALIDRGRILLEGSMGDLVGEGFSDRMDLAFRRPLSASEWKAISTLPFARSVEPADGGLHASLLMKPGDPDGGRRSLVRALADLDLPVLSLNPRRLTLEELFLSKVGRHE